jgi:hypothetical protein
MNSFMVSRRTATSAAPTGRHTDVILDRVARVGPGSQTLICAARYRGALSSEGGGDWGAGGFGFLTSMGSQPCDSYRNGHID